jgi:general secretion pathway protein H
VFKTQLKNNNQDGFTLLEIMLVVLLMGMVSAGVVMTLPDSLTSEENIDWQAQRFSTVLQFAEDEALISGTELGIFFDKNSYQFVFYEYKSKKWLPVVSDFFEGHVELPESINLTYLLSGSVWGEIASNGDDFIDQEYLVDIEGDDDIPSLIPQVYVMSSGEVTPFSLRFSDSTGSEKQQTLTVVVSMSGAVSFPELERQ